MGGHTWNHYTCVYTCTEGLTAPCITSCYVNTRVLLDAVLLQDKYVCAPGICGQVEEAAGLVEPWDVLNLQNARWQGLRSWWMTDRLIRRGCVHRAFPQVGMAYSVGLLYSFRGVETILNLTKRVPWREYDLWLGRRSQEHALRIFHWGCLEVPIEHGRFRSTLDH